MENEWLKELSEQERKVILAGTSHSIIDFDFTLTEDEWDCAKQVFNDLNTMMNGGEVAGVCVRIPDEYRASVWAAMTAYVEDIHAPLDNLKSEDWTKMEALYEVLNHWDDHLEIKTVRP